MPSELTSASLANRTVTFFGLGGSGVRALEPLLHLCALGLGPRRLNVVLIDPDQSNAAVTRSRGILDAYRKTRDAMMSGESAGDGYFRTDVKDVVGSSVLWSPIADDESGSGAFGVRVGRALLTGGAAEVGRVFDLLYSRQLQAMDLTLGFRGVPSIGTIFMNRLRDESFFEQILVDAAQEADSVFFAIGSIFGGTGAAGLPVVGRALVDGVARSSQRNPIQGVDPRRVGAALLLPYFTLPTPSANTADDGGIRPETALFSQNAAAAFPTYAAGQAGYSGYYVLGDDQPREQQQNAVGGSAQDNRGHYVELFAAFAALDFATRGGEQTPSPTFRATGVAGSSIRWDDLPIDAQSRQRMLGGIVAMHTFLTIFRPDGRSHPGLARALSGVTWMSELGMRASELDSRSEAFDYLGDYFLRMWKWFGELNASNPALELVGANGRVPTSLPLDQTGKGRRSARALPRTVQGGYEPFRYWNMAASKLHGKNFGGFLDVMRIGSESFAAERFPETINE